MSDPAASKCRLPDSAARTLPGVIEAERWHDGPGRCVVLLTAAGLGVLLAGLALCAPLSRDENMYVAAGALLRRARLYRDYAYFQTPYLPWLYSVVFPLFGGYLLLAGRLISLAAAGLSLALVWRVGIWISGSRRAAWLALVLVGTHHLGLFALPYARNHPVALACSLAACAAGWRGLAGGRWQGGWWMAAGALAAAAAGLRLMHLPLALALLLSCMLGRRRVSLRDRARGRGLPFALGFALASAPIFLYAMRVGTPLFIFNNLGYHLANEQWYSAQHGPEAGALTKKLLYMGEYAMNGSGAALPTALLVAWGANCTRRASHRRSRRARSATQLIWLTVLAALCAALLATPPQRDYLAMVVPFAGLGLCVLLRRARGGPGAQLCWPPRWHRVALAVLVVLSAVTAGVWSLRHLRRLPNVATWTPVMEHDIGAQVAGLITPQSGAPLIATLAPIVPLEAGLSIYPEMATGGFLLRVAPYMARTTAGVPPGFVFGPAALPGVLADHPPDAILTGFDDLEAPLIEFAEEHGYQPVQLARPAELFVRQPRRLPP